MLKYRLSLVKSPVNRLIFNRFTTQVSTNKINTATSNVEWEKARPFKEIPTPGLSFPFKFFPGGELHNVSLLQLQHYIRDNYGEIVKCNGILGSPDFVMICDPNEFAKVFRTEGVWPGIVPLFTQKYYRQKVRPDVYKTVGLVAAENKEWQKLRTIVNPVMMQPKIVTLYIPRIDEVTRDFIEITKKCRDTKNETPAGFGQYMQRWALEAIGTIALDTRFGVLENKPGNEADKINEMMNEFFDLSYQLEILPSFWRYFTTPKLSKLMKLSDEITRYTKKHVDEAIERIEAKKDKKPEEEQSVLERLLRVDKSVAMVMAMDMLEVGVNTTTASAKALLYLLAKNPEKQEKLRKEILSILPTKDTLLTTENMKQLPYLRACMKEANRALPVTVGTARKTSQDIVIHGYRIPKGIYIAMCVHLCLESEEHYPKAKQFIPERWLKDNSHIDEGCPHARDAHPFTYLPFGFGPRACVGKRLAELEIAIFIIRFIREFNVEWHYPEPKVKSSFVEELEGDLKFRLNDCTA